MTFEVALKAALLLLNITTPIPVDHWNPAWAPRFMPHTINGQSAVAWTYERDEIAVGVSIPWEEYADEAAIRHVAAHEACHIKLHMKYIRMPAHKIGAKQTLLNELEAEKCALWVLGVQAGNAQDK